MQAIMAMPTADRIRINHALGLLANLDKLRRSEWECDYDIISKGQRFPVHKSVLGGCSTALQNMVQKSKYQETFEIGPDGTREVIKFMYSGTAEITEYNFQDLMHAAKVYQLDDLKILCVNYVEHNLTIKNCFQKLRKCMVYRLDNSTKVFKFIKEHFDDVMATEGFKRLTQTSLSLRLKDLQLSSHQLWQGIFSWVQHEKNSREPEMVKLVEENIERFSLNTILDEMLQCELVDNSGRCRELIMARILLESSRIKTLINANNCFKLSKLCANSPHSNTVLLQNGIVEFMIENVARIEDNEAIVDLPEEGIVALFQGIRQKNIRGEKSWKLALKWTKHKLAERRDTFPQLFSCVNLNDFTFEFINQVIHREELVKGSLACNQSVMDHVFKFMLDQFTEVIATEWFKNLTQMELSQRLKQLRLPPYRLWLGISSWADHDIATRQSGMIKLVKENLDRFSPGIILNVMLQSNVVNRCSSCKELLMHHVLSTPDRFTPEINTNNCFNLCILCATSPHGKTLPFQNSIVEFMIENFRAIENNKSITDLPTEGMVALCNGIVKKKDIPGEKIWNLAVKWTKHKLVDRQVIFPQIFSCLNLNDFTFDFINRVISSEDLVMGSPTCYHRVMDHLHKLCAYETPEKKPRIEALSEIPSTSAPYVGEKSKHRPHIVVYTKQSGNVVGFDLSMQKETEVRSALTKNISKLQIVSDDFQTAFTLKGDLYVLRGTELSVYCQKRSKKYWLKRKSLYRPPRIDAKVVTSQDRFHLIETGCMKNYDPETDNWSHISIPEITGRKFAVCANSTDIYILGGDLNPQLALEYNLATLSVKEITSTIYPRVDSSAVSVMEELVLLGGEDQASQRSVEFYVQATRRWTLLQAKMEFSRWSFSACAYDGKIYAVGGKKDSSSKDSIEVCDTMSALAKWTKFCDIPTFQTPFNACVFTIPDNVETTTKEIASSSRTK